jgi:hypothetical protein
MPGWLLISYHVPTNPSALRVATWRALKQRGAVTLGAGLYALPATPEHEAALLQLSNRIAEGGGTAISLSAAALTDADERALQLRFQAARRDEYLQVLKSARKLVDHIGREEESHDYRFAEVESLEEELNKVRRQFERVVERDSCDSPVRGEAQAALTVAEERLQLYMDNAYREENQG